MKAEEILVVQVAIVAEVVVVAASEVTAVEETAGEEEETGRSRGGKMFRCLSPVTGNRELVQSSATI